MISMIKDSRLLLIVLANLTSTIGTSVTTISVSWLIVHKDNGEAVLGYTVLGIAIILFFANPYIGIIVDRFSRKKMYLFNQVLGLTLVLSMTLLGMINGSYATWQLIIIMFSGSLFYMLHFPTLMAFVQEIFDRRHYRPINSLLEVEMQISSAVAGGVAGLILGIIKYDYIFLFDACTYVLSLIFILCVPYQKEYTNKEKKVAFVSDIYEGFQFLKGKTPLILLLLCTMMPFIGVMMVNYIQIIYVNSVLNTTARTLGFAEMSFAIGAILSGLLITLINKKFSYFGTILITMAAYMFYLLTMAWIPLALAYISISMLGGIGNSGTRIMRKTVMMENIPNHIIGRVNSFFKSVELIIRIILLVFFVQIIKEEGTLTTLIIMSLLMSLAILGILASQTLATRTKKGIQAEHHMNGK